MILSIFEVAVAVFFILELDDWIYALMIEPLALFEEDHGTVFVLFATLQDVHSD